MTTGKISRMAEHGAHGKSLFLGSYPFRKLHIGSRDIADASAPSSGAKPGQHLCN